MAYRAATFTLTLLLCFGCESRSQDFRHQFHAFGTLVTIDFFDVSPDSSASAIAVIESRIKDLDTNWYPWRAGELQRINSAIANRQSIEVSPLLAELLRR